MKIPLSALAILTAFSGSALAEDAAEIAAKLEMQKISALKTYLEDNPEAADHDQALTFLVNSHMAIGDFEAVPDYLDKRYEAQPKGAEMDLQVVIGEILQPYIEACSASGQKERAKAFVAQFEKDIAGRPEAEQIQQFLPRLTAGLGIPGVGEKMEIAFTGLKGEEVDLAKMEDKVVLVDFWATWCGPCIAELPNVLAAYEKYHDKGFAIVGISLDDDKSKLESFIEERSMPWPQHFDGKGWENELAQEFGITSIPATFLVQNGEIVAANLRGPALEEEVAKLLAE